MKLRRSSISLHGSLPVLQQQSQEQDSNQQLRYINTAEAPTLKKLTAAKERRRSIGTFEAFASSSEPSSECREKIRRRSSSASMLKRRTLSFLSLASQTSTSGTNSAAARSMASSRDSLLLSLTPSNTGKLTGDFAQTLDRRLSVLEEVSVISETARIAASVISAPAKMHLSDVGEEQMILSKLPTAAPIKSLEYRKQHLINRRKSLQSSESTLTNSKKIYSQDDEIAPPSEKIDDAFKPSVSEVSATESLNSLRSRDSIMNLRQSPTRGKKVSLAALMKKASRRPDQLKKKRISHHAAGLWLTLIFSMKFASSCSRSAQKVAALRLKELEESVAKTSKNAANLSAKPLTELLKEMTRDIDNVTSFKLKTLLLIPPRERHFDIVQKINTVMNECIPDFGKAFVDEQERYHICKHLRFDFLKKDTVLLWEEHICTCFYFLIYGRVDIFKINKGSKLKV